MKKKISKLLTSVITFFVLLYNKICGAYEYAHALYAPRRNPEMERVGNKMVLILLIPIILMIGMIISYKKRNIEKKKRIFYTIINVIVIIISLIMMFGVIRTFYYLY